MAIYQSPKLSSEDKAVLELIGEQKQRLRHYTVQNPQRWTGQLRRNLMARAIQGSNSIEGYHATIDDAIAAVDDEQPMDASAETWREIIGYRHALTYILQLSEDDDFAFHTQLIKSLHFMMMQHSLKKRPGRWRPGEIHVVNELTGERVYEGPDPLQIPKLIDELVAYLNSPSGEPIEVKAAMAHLNLTMIHPFADNNGRMARALQTLVLSREGSISPIFSSIEEWLGRNTEAYYDILAQTGQGSWHPEYDAHVWVQFCLRAHFQQAQTIVGRNQRLSRIYQDAEKIVQSHGLPDRVTTALVDAAIGLKVRAGRYKQENDLSDVVASRDLRRLSELTLLIPHGERRGRYYTGAETLTALGAVHKAGERAADPYDIIRTRHEAGKSPELPF